MLSGFGVAASTEVFRPSQSLDGRTVADAGATLTTRELAGMDADASGTGGTLAGRSADGFGDAGSCDAGGAATIGVCATSVLATS